MVVKRILKSLLVFVTLASIFGFYSHRNTYAEEADPMFSLTVAKSSVNVGDTVEVKATQLRELTADSENFTLVVPTGMKLDQTALKQNGQAASFQSHQESDKLILTVTGQTAKSFTIPLVAETAGTFSMSVLSADQLVTSNVVQTTAIAAPVESSSSSASDTEAGSTSSSAISESSSTASSNAEQTESNSSADVVSESSSSETNAESSSSSAEKKESAVSSSSESKKKISGRSLTTASIALDQSNNIVQLSYLYYYNQSTGQPISGSIKDSDKEAIKVTYNVVKQSGNGPEAPNSNVEQSFGTINTSGGGKSDKFSYMIPAKNLPTYSSSIVGSVYRLVVTFTDPAKNIRNANFRIVYIAGELTLTAPSNISFGTDLDAAATGTKVYMPKSVTGNALAVKDTRTIPSGVIMNGWSVTATLSKQMTSTTSGGVLTNSLHYINDGTDYTLGTAAAPVKSLAKAEPNTTTNISGAWDSKNGLAFEPTAGQPVAGESYAGAVTWTLQDTPGN